MTTSNDDDNNNYKDINSVNIYFSLIVISEQHLIQLSLTKAQKDKKKKGDGPRPDQGPIASPLSLPLQQAPQTKTPIITQASDFLVFLSFHLSR